MSEQKQTAKTRSGPLGLSHSEFQDLIDSTPSLQPRGHVNASLYGWVPGTKGVWVLEAPTDEQYARLRSLPRCNDADDPEAVFNANLRDVGAVFYADYNDNEGAQYLMNLTTDPDYPYAKGRGKRQEARGRGFEGMVIDGEETRRRNDGHIHLRHADTTNEVEVPEEGKAKL
ncbi:hypothetical protein P7C71_g4211, partial [Lecanoromycetidae sp. Uapishka_2]